MGSLPIMERAARWNGPAGWVNRAVPADELDVVVDRLARNIAALPGGVIAAAKRAVVPEDLAGGLLREHDAWAGQVFRPAAGRLIRGGPAHGARTRDGERNLEGLLLGAGWMGPGRRACLLTGVLSTATVCGSPTSSDANVVDRHVAW